MRTETTQPHRGYPGVPKNGPTNTHTGHVAGEKE
jgi:hypothetical protein